MGVNERKLIFFIMLLLLFSEVCKSSKEKEVEAKVLKHLYEKYDAEFAIEKTRYINKNGIWEIKIKLKENEKIEFYARTGGSFKGQITDGYALVRQAE